MKTIIFTTLAILVPASTVPALAVPGLSEEQLQEAAASIRALQADSCCRHCRLPCDPAEERDFVDAIRAAQIAGIKNVRWGAPNTRLAGFLIITYDENVGEAKVAQSLLAAASRIPGFEAWLSNGGRITYFPDWSQAARGASSGESSLLSSASAAS